MTQQAPRSYRIRQKHACDDCGEAGPQMLILQRELWLELHPTNHRAILCPACMRVRWGKDFLFTDLLAVFVNIGYVKDTWPERVLEFISLVEAKLLDDLGPKHRLYPQMMQAIAIERQTVMASSMGHDSTLS